MSTSEWERTRDAEFNKIGEGMRHGRRYFVEDHESITTVNTPLLLRKFANASGESTIDTIFLLLRRGIIRIEWDHDTLIREAETFGITLTVEVHNITESYDADMDVYRKTVDRP